MLCPDDCTSLLNCSCMSVRTFLRFSRYRRLIDDSNPSQNWEPIFKGIGLKLIRYFRQYAFAWPSPLHFDELMYQFEHLQMFLILVLAIKKNLVRAYVDWQICSVSSIPFFSDVRWFLYLLMGIIRLRSLGLKNLNHFWNYFVHLILRMDVL